VPRAREYPFEPPGLAKVALRHCVVHLWLLERAARLLRDRRHRASGRAEEEEVVTAGG